MKPQEIDQLTADIDVVATNAAHQMATFDQRAFLRQHLPTAMRLLLIVPVVAVLWQLIRWGAGFSATPYLQWFGWVFLTVVVPLVWLSGEATMRRFQVHRRRALRAADEQLGSTERIVTADSFLQHPSRDGFMQAAIEDAVQWTKSGRETRLVSADAELQNRRGFWPVPVAVAALLLALVVGRLERASATDERLPIDVSATDQQATVEPASEDPSQANPPDQEQPEPQSFDETPRRQPRKAVNRQGPAGVAVPEDIEESQGKVSEGETRESQQSANPSSAKGAPSASGQPSKSGKEPKKKPRKKQKKTADKEREKKAREEDEKPSGATAGQGSSKGSDNNAAPSDWASSSQAATPDDEDLDDEDEVDDEEEEQESRGGVQPNMRDRRTPVNRDLQIGFGSNRPNPDANGRGGPGGQKKSRGVASLVLGVPIPDRVSGQPNKGRIRITQQRIAPEAEQADAVSAQDRKPREGAIGPIHHPDFSPWLQDFVRRYFLNRRAKHPLKTPQSVSPDDTDTTMVPSASGGV